jgi:hypothetical protein
MHPPTEVVVEDVRNVMGFNDSIACFETRCYMGIPPVQNAGVWWIGECVCAAGNGLIQREPFLSTGLK